MTTPPAVQPYVHRTGEGDAFWFLGSLATVKAGGAQTRGRLAVIDFLNPPGFAAPLHRHVDEDEAFYVLSGAARFRCDDSAFEVGPGDFVLLPAGRPQRFIVGPDEPLRTLQITTPGGFEGFLAEAGEPAAELRIPDPAPVDPAALGHAAARHGMQILGPPPLQEAWR